MNAWLCAVERGGFRGFRMPRLHAVSFSLSGLLCALLFFAPAALAAAPVVPLRNVEIRTFSAPPEPWSNTVTPAFKESVFPLAQAANGKAVIDRVGGLNSAQERYLEKHRFLLLPTDGRDMEGLTASGYGTGYDEMLEYFDGIGGGSDIMNRRPDTAVFIGPDPFLHALHSFFAMRLKSMEQAEMSRSLYFMLQGLYANAAALRATASGQSAADWERLQAQLVVPLILMRNTSLPGGVLMYNPDDETRLHDYLFDPDVMAAARGQEEPAATGRADSLEHALALFEEYRDAFSPETAAAITRELERIYAAQTRAPSLLGLTPTYDAQIDYTQFKPRGHYESNPISRAYFRTMIQLGQIGWNLHTQAGLTDAMNFALAMSYVGPETADANGSVNSATAGGSVNATAANDSANSAAAGGSANATAAGGSVNATAADSAGGIDGKQADLLDSWRLVMEISGFFVGYPDAASYPEWQDFMRKYAGVDAFTPETASDVEVLARLSSNLKELKPSIPYFTELQKAGPTGVLCVFPQRFTISWLIGDELTWKETPAQEKLPVVFSGLWVPATLGSAYAQSMVEKQSALCLAGRPTATLEGAPLSKGDQAPGPMDPTILREAADTLTARISALSADLAKQTETSWHSSIGAIWLRLLGTITAAYGEGYPLYMQDAAFGAKQLETFMGSFTELKHDTLLYEKPLYAEGGEGGDDEKPLPIPKGLVEPNPLFWNSLLRAVEYMEGGFKAYGLYPEDLEEYGALSRFHAQAALCAALAEKELRGEALTDEEYESIRTLNLQYMAAPLDYSIVRTEEDRQSGLIVDVQTANLNVEEPVIVYEATAVPQLMLVLAGNDDSPRLTIGVAYNHREFITPYGPRLTDSEWKGRVYSGGGQRDDAGKWQPGAQPDLPAKNFWYAPLAP